MKSNKEILNDVRQWCLNSNNKSKPFWFVSGFLLFQMFGLITAIIIIACIAMLIFYDDISKLLKKRDIVPKS